MSMPTLPDTHERLRALAAQAIEHAQSCGADACDALVIAAEDTSVAVRQGRVESIERSDANGLGLRVFVTTTNGPAFATASTDDLSEQGIRQLAAQTVAMARIATPDPDAVPPVGAEHPDRATMQLWEAEHPVFEPWNLEGAREAALHCEEQALAHAGITNSEGAEASYGTTHVAYASADGFAGVYSRTQASLGISVLAGRGDAMQRDYAWHRAHTHRELRRPVELGDEAAERATRRLGATAIASGKLPVVFEPRIAASLLGHLLAAINGRAVLQKRSFLADRLHQAIFPDTVTIRDVPDHPEGLGNRLFDGEGTLCRPCTLVERGRLEAFLTDRYAAKRLGLPARGHARRGLTGDIGIGPSNALWEPGNSTPEEIFRDLGTALLVTELIGFGVNGTTGDYSRGAAGFLIENGEIGRPVQGITIAGNLRDMYARICHVGNDLTWFGSTAVPTLAIEAMAVAGQHESKEQT